MRLLLDTHVLLWWLADSPRLGREARGLIARSPAVHVSAASAWEIGIKRAIGKLTAPANLPEALANSGFFALSITIEHAAAAASLPRHHDDPFDRMLVAQAKAEKLTLLTSDQRLTEYGAAVKLV